MKDTEFKEQLLKMASEIQEYCRRYERAENGKGGCREHRFFYWVFGATKTKY